MNRAEISNLSNKELVDELRRPTLDENKNIERECLYRIFKNLLNIGGKIEEYRLKNYAEKCCLEESKEVRLRKKIFEREFKLMNEEEVKEESLKKQLKNIKKQLAILEKEISKELSEKNGERSSL